jgi:hypothetical protein
MSSVGHEAMLDMTFRTNLGLATCAVAELGIADLVPRGVGRTVAELATEAGCDAEHLYGTLRLLASYFEDLIPALRVDAGETLRGQSGPLSSARAARWYDWRSPLRRWPHHQPPQRPSPPDQEPPASFWVARVEVFLVR